MMSLPTLLQSTTEDKSYFAENNVDYPPPTMIVQDKRTPVYTEPTLNQEGGGEPTDTFRIESIIEIAVGGFLVVSLILVLAFTLYRKSRIGEKGFCCLDFSQSEEKQSWMKVDQNYETIQHDRISKMKKSSSRLSLSLKRFSSLTLTIPRSKNQTILDPRDEDAKLGNGPSLSPSQERRLQAFSQSVRRGSIPFMLPPTAFGRSPSNDNSIEHIQPSITSMQLSDAVNGNSTEGTRVALEDLWNSSVSYEGHDVFDNRSAPNSPETKIKSSGQFRNSFIGQIQPELYKYSIHEEHDLPPSQYGRIWFSLVYDGAVEALTVKVIKIRQLPGRRSNIPHDSFVKLFLLPDERMSQQTKVKRRTNNPAFNETFVFQVSENCVKDRTLRLSVYDVDKRKVARHLLGHSLVTLSEVDLASQAEDVMWRDLDERAHPGDSGATLGELNVSLSYLPSMNRLTVVILRARNLREIDLEATGVYVKVTLRQGHQVIKTKKTTVTRGVCDPNYNQSFSFTVTSQDIESSCLSLTVVTLGYHTGFRQFTSSFKNLVSSGKPNNEHKYGRVVIGSFMFCRGEQLLHWQEMLAQPRKGVMKWHPLSEISGHD